MSAEDVKQRRGEPVILTWEDGTERTGTIEWGDGDRYDFSVYLEHGGRIIFGRHEQWPKMRTDPGGDRPVWRRVTSRT